MTTQAVGSSLEIIDHHYALHRRDCPMLGERCFTCECGGTVIIQCVTCRGGLFTAHPVWPPCEHAEDLSSTWREITCGEVPS